MSGRSGFRVYGFALVELLVALAVLAVMAGAAVPALGVWLDREPGPAEEVVALLRSARAEALTTGRPVALAIDAGTGRWLSERDGRLPVEGRLRLGEATVEGPDRLRLRLAPTGGVAGGVIAIRESGAIRVVRADPWTGEVTLHVP